MYCWSSIHFLDFPLVIIKESTEWSHGNFRSPMDTRIEIALMYSRQQRQKNPRTQSRSRRERHRRDALLLRHQYQSSSIPDPAHGATDFAREYKVGYPSFMNNHPLPSLKTSVPGETVRSMYGRKALNTGRNTGPWFTTVFLTSFCRILYIYGMHTGKSP